MATLAYVTDKKIPAEMEYPQNLWKIL